VQEVMPTGFTQHFFWSSFKACFLLLERMVNYPLT